MFIMCDHLSVVHLVSKLAKAFDCLHAGSSASDLTLDPDEDSQILVPRKSLKKPLLVTPPEKKRKGNGSAEEINTTPTEPVSTSASSTKSSSLSLPKLRTMKRQLSFANTEGHEDDNRSDRGKTADQGGDNQVDKDNKGGQKTPKGRVAKAAKSKAGKKQKVGEGKTSSPDTSCTSVASPTVSKAPPTPPPPAKSAVPVAPPKATPKAAVPAPKTAAKTPVPKSEPTVSKKEDEVWEEEARNDTMLRDILNRAATVDALNSGDDGLSQLGSTPGSEAPSRKSKKRNQKKVAKRDKKTHALKMRFYRSLES